MYWQGETDAQCSPFRDAASSLLASGEGWKRELIGSSTPTSTLDASHSRLAGVVILFADLPTLKKTNQQQQQQKNKQTKKTHVCQYSKQTCVHILTEIFFLGGGGGRGKMHHPSIKNKSGKG